MRIFAKKMQKNLVISKKSSTFAPAFDQGAVSCTFRRRLKRKRVKPFRAEAASPVCRETALGAIAQLVEHDLAKVGVASSSLVFRSFFLR